MKSATSISEELEGILKRALDARNYLSHHYFRERAEAFMRRDGRDQMIEELETYQMLFDDADERLTTALNPLREKYNLTDEHLKPYQDRYLEKFGNDH
ncbi:MAG: hypothetical protein Q8N34_10565 [Gammaproteobacteria bacterium]|nr:hypothetical protein [Gammaproteobacteria bacterium]